MRRTYAVMAGTCRWPTHRNQTRIKWSFYLISDITDHRHTFWILPSAALMITPYGHVCVLRDPAAPTPPSGSVSVLIFAA